MTRKILRYLCDESGATAVEYGLIAALVSVAGIGALSLMGSSLVNIFSAIGTLVSDAAESAKST